jgi:hypothetical protein
MSERNLMAYEHWKESRAVGFSPEERNDPIVRRNAALFELFEKLKAKKQEREFHEALIGLAGRPRL